MCILFLRGDIFLLRPIIDIFMTIILLLSMSYELFGTVFLNLYDYGALIHEILGFSLIILFFWHLWLNRWWLKNIFKGKYNLTRIILTGTNIILIFVVVILVVTGIIMSRFLESFDFIEFEGLMSFAREFHIIASYWGYVLMSFHIGLNWHIFSAMMLKNTKFKNKLFTIFFTVIFFVYGVKAFIKRQFWDYMSMNSVFVFFDFEEPFMFFILDYLAIMILFAILGHYTILFLRSVKK